MDSPFVLLQALKGAALSCLHALRFAARPASQAWLQAVTGYSDKTISSAMRKLLELKLARYSIPEEGWFLAPSEALEQFYEPANRKIYGDPPVPALESESILSDSIEEREKGVLTDSAEAENAGAQEPAEVKIDLEALLEAIQEQFGEPLLLSRKRLPDASLLLGLAAEAQHKREHLGYPTRAIYGSLKCGRIPDGQDFERPGEFLPGWFMAHIGLAGVGEPEVEADLKVEAGSGAPEKDFPAIDRASLGQKVGPESSLSAGEAWELVCSQLRQNLPPTVYARFLSVARALEFLPEPGVLVVTASDPEARLWLDGRLRPNLERELRQLCGRQVRLEVREPARED